MKKLHLIVLASIAIFFASCSSDDSPSTKDKLTKKWYWVSLSAQGQTHPYDGHEPCGKDYLEFLDNGTLLVVNVLDCENEIDAAEWILDGKTVTVSNGSTIEALEITRLTSKELELTNMTENGPIVLSFADR